MIIDFSQIPEKDLPNFRGGEKSYNPRMFLDGGNKVMLGRLVPGASIGMHTHETDCEVMYFLEGSGKLLYDGDELRLSPGTCHYCAKGCGHSIVNDGDTDLKFFAMVAVQ